MAVKRLQTRIQLKRDLSSAWSTQNVALLAGEFGWDSTENNFKVGDGTHNWNSINYAIPYFAQDEFTITTDSSTRKNVVSIGTVPSEKVQYNKTSSVTPHYIQNGSTLTVALETLDAQVHTATSAGVTSLGNKTGAIAIGNGLKIDTIAGTPDVNTLKVRLAQSNSYLAFSASETDGSRGIMIDPDLIDSTYITGTTVNTGSNLATVDTVTAALGTLDVAEFPIATQSSNAITIHGIKEEDGKIAVGTSGVTLADVAATGAAANVSYTPGTSGLDATTVQAAIEELATGVAGGVNDVTVDSNTVVATVNGKKVAQLLSSDGYSENNKLATQATVTSAINGLDVNDISGFGPGKTLSALSETDGKIAASFQDISITHTQVSDWNANVGVKSVALGSTGEGTSAVPTLQVTNGGTPDTVSNVLHFTHTPSSTEKVLTSSDLTGIVGAMVYKGVVDGTHALPASPEKGWVYMVAADGTYASEECETGDMIVYNGTSWDVINGENQVTNAGATITAGDANASTIATVDGTAITAKVEVDGGNATIASKSGNVVTIKTGVTQTGTTGTIANDSGSDIVLDDVAVTGAASDLSVTSATYGGSEATTNAQTALTNLASAITNANITIDGHKGTITTGNGLSHVASDGGTFAVQLDTSSTNGLSVGENGVAMAKASGSNFGTVEVTTGNGLSISNGVVSYAHNTTAIEVATKNDNTNVVTIKGTLTPDAGDNITGSGDITLSAVAVTGDAADVSIEDSGNNFTADTVEGALTELAGKTAGTLNTTNVGGLATNASESLAGTVNLHKISKTGNTDDLIQGLTILLDCGTASTVTAVPDSNDISNDPGNTPADNPGANS